jgi:Ca2+-binding RTX toxin-like protein
MNVANASDTIIIDAPPAGVRVVVNLVPGSTFRFDFPLEEIAYSIVNGDVLLTRADGGEIVLEGLASAETWQESPSFLTPDGTILPLESLVNISVTEGDLTSALGDVNAELLNEIETAAGGEPLGRLHETTSSPIVVPESRLEATGALEATNVDTRRPTSFVRREPLDDPLAEEQFASDAGVAAEPLGDPLLSVTYAVGTEDAPIPLAIDATSVGGDGTQTLSIKVDGVPAGAALSAGHDNGDTTWTLTSEDLEGLTISAPPHDANDFELTVTAAATQSDGISKSTSASAEIVVNAVADTPSLVVGDATAGSDEDSVIAGTSGADTLFAGHGSDTIVASGGNDIIFADSGDNAVTAALSISANLVDVDGSESLSILVSDIPAGGRLSAGRQVSESTWVLASSDLVGLTITIPADTPTFALTITAASSDVDPDSGLTDSTASMATINVTVVPPISADVIDAGAGRDTVYAGAGSDVVQGGGGADLLYGGAGNDSLFGGNSSDTLYGEEGADRLEGEAGNDILFAGTGDDVLLGGIGRDTLYGNEGADRLEGEDSNDLLIGGSGDDVLLGGAGGDKLFGEEGADSLVGGAGADTLYGGGDNDVLLGGDDNDRLYGGEGADTLEGGSGTNRLYGEAGDDVLLGGEKTDSLVGGEGNDILVGGSGKDKLFGDAGDDILYGGDKVDRLYGGEGDDVIVGGADKDFMEGGAGSDRFVWDSDDLAGKPDVIEDFETGIDRIDISAVLDGYDPETSDINDFVQVSTKRGDTTLSVSSNGAGEWNSIAVLEGVMDFDIDRDVLAITTIDPDSP